MNIVIPLKDKKKYIMKFYFILTITENFTNHLLDKYKKQILSDSPVSTLTSKFDYLTTKINNIYQTILQTLKTITTPICHYDPINTKLSNSLQHFFDKPYSKI